MFFDDYGLLEIGKSDDLRKLDEVKIQNEVNDVIKRNLSVNKFVKNREDAKREIDLSNIPESVQEVRIVEIFNFDKRPCRDHHVDNINDIGKFNIININRVGKDRYRFIFNVK